MSPANPRIGVIADSVLQRHVVCKMLETVGYGLATAVSPEKVDEALIQKARADVWLVDIEEEDKWADIIILVYEVAEVPVLLGEGNAPNTSTLPYQRWQRKMVEKLEKVVGKPITDGVEISTLHPVSVEDDTPSEVEAETTGEPAAHIWVLGASLGGPRAVKEFLQALPESVPVAFLIAQHIEPGFEDTLTKVWGDHSATSFLSPRMGRTISHGQSMIAPLEQVMVFNQFSQVVLYDEPWDGPYSPCINQVMTLMATNLGAQTGAILFSGMGDDGTLGAKKMRECGIEVWAQTTATCANSSMPDSAREAGCVTFSGSPAELAQRLVDYLAAESTELLVN